MLKLKELRYFSIKTCLVPLKYYYSVSSVCPCPQRQKPSVKTSPPPWELPKSPFVALKHLLLPRELRNGRPCVAKNIAI